MGSTAKRFRKPERRKESGGHGWVLTECAVEFFFFLLGVLGRILSAVVRALT